MSIIFLLQHTPNLAISPYGTPRSRPGSLPLSIRQAHVAELAGGQEHIWVVEAAVCADRARAWVEAVVGEVDPALPAIVVFILQADFDVGALLAALALGLEEQGLRTLKGDRKSTRLNSSH